MLECPNHKTVEHIKVAPLGKLNPYTSPTTNALFERDRRNYNDVVTALDSGTVVLPDLAVPDKVRVDTATKVLTSEIGNCSLDVLYYEYSEGRDKPYSTYFDMNR